MKKLQQSKKIRKAESDSRWTPVRRGPIYCSPGCGGKCTYEAYQQACRDAAKLAKRLGKTWVVEVWENLGWHYAVHSSCERLRVHPPSHGDGTYACEIGHHYWAHAKTPEQAIHLSLKSLRDEIAVLVIKLAVCHSPAVLDLKQPKAKKRKR